MNKRQFLAASVAALTGVAISVSDSLAKGGKNPAVPVSVSGKGGQYGCKKGQGGRN